MSEMRINKIFWNQTVIAKYIINGTVRKNILAVQQENKRELTYKENL